MEAYELYKDIAERTQGDVYIGVVGPVRTGKSTFIKRFMEKLVIPGIENQYIRARTQDELPQSGSGRTVMTTQPTFVPGEAVEITLPGDSKISVRMIDSVGYLVDGALGSLEGDIQRMVKTPWAEEDIPFEEAAEIGTRRVIGDHSTIGLVITTDGSLTDLPRSAYAPVEKRVIDELKMLQKPFAVILNCENPTANKTEQLRQSLEELYAVPVAAINVEKMEETDILHVLDEVLKQFPVLEVKLQTPEWLGALSDDHWLLAALSQILESHTPDRLKMGEVADWKKQIAEDSEYIDSVIEKNIDLGSGKALIQLGLKEGLFNQILAQQCGTEIKNDAHLLALLCELVKAKKEYDHVAAALKSVRETGYGLVPPLVEEMTLQEPEIMKQGGKFGVRLRASAPSLHLIRVDIQTEVSPVVGTEQQSEEMIRYLMEGFEQDTQKLWQSNLFGKPLSDLVREGLSNKLMHMPADTQVKVQQTLEKIINEGTGGMICILL